MRINDSGGSSQSTVGSVGKAVGRVVSKTARKVARKSNVGTSARKVARRVAPRRSSSSSHRSSGSSGSSRRRISSSSGGSSKRRVSSPVARPKPAAPKAPSLATYLGTDSVYQQSVRGGKRSLTDFLSELGRRKGEAGTQYNQTKASMERDRGVQLEDLRNEFASRGLIQSGLYGQEQGRFQQQFQEQSGALDQQQAALLADILSQEKNYRRENDLALEQAKQEALMRRAAKYKIGA